MARQKNRKKTKRRTKKNDSPEITASIIALLSVIGLFDLGFFGTFINALIRLVVGNMAPYALGLLLIYCLLVVLNGQIATRMNRWFGYALCLMVIVALGLHAIQFQPVAANDATKIISETFNHAKVGFKGDFSPLMGGGILGAILYQTSYFLVSQVGTLIILFLLVVFWLARIFDIQWADFIVAIQNVWAIMVNWFQQFQSGIKTQVQEKQRSHRKQKENAKKERANSHRKAPSKDEPATQEPSAVEPEAPQSTSTDLDQFEIVGPETGTTVQTSLPIAPDLGTPEKSITPTPTATDEQDEEDDGVDLDRLSMEVAEDENPDYQLPTSDLLDPVKVTDQSSEYAVIKQNVKKLEQTLRSFNVDAKVTKANLGPAVTKYEIQPAIGTKVSKITNLADDIALALAAKDIRIEAPIPGKSVIGIEVPNQTVSVVSYRDVVENAPHSDRLLEVPLGRDISGNIRVSDLTKMPHLLIAGSTGSGKSVAINGIIVSLLMRAKPNEVKMMMIDPKKVELTVYTGIPHLLTPVVTNPRKAAGALNKVVEEMERRYELFASTGQRNIDGYNHFIRQHNLEEGENIPTLPFIVVIVDELADLMMVASKEVEAAITRLAQMARAAGIHMILATQRPSVDVITGIIKANVPSRIAFAVSSGTDSRTIIDQNGAEKLLGRGDMLYLPMGEGKPIRVQGAFIADEEVEKVVDFVKNQQEANYVETMMPKEPQASDSGEELDELWGEALNFLKTRDTVSISMLQRRFRIGYNRAARLMDDMEKRQIVGPQEGSKPRAVNLPKDEDNQETPPM
ncbi:MAG: DNA translocase FtsK [Aerococcus sp.]|nr:DNA translocase FtsK [Aerococcus sp.]